MKSVDGLSEEAKIAYQAFLDMSNSKSAHFNCLEAIETIYESGGHTQSRGKSGVKKIACQSR